ncbi:hypothetical protein I7I50_05669 [Histoplasma capsulatum G186AR]|uniref:Uncharacterized protein n=1 Tax=Ajellomyces capsulatus TaxID=5037 RepID=A0A8H8D941_AJECA|nr:hypothetical protein I7I52_03929 [Histoplasma capsulatum]QSS76273.1 hypothetical protein I7I50_05669 [Histoplasma capsulatum G186AR]
MIYIQLRPCHCSILNRIRQCILVNIHTPHPLLHNPECLLVQSMMRLRRMRTCQHHTIRYCQRSFQRTMIHRTTQTPQDLTLPQCPGCDCAACSHTAPHHPQLQRTSRRAVRAVYSR